MLYNSETFLWFPSEKIFLQCRKKKKQCRENVEIPKNCKTVHKCTHAKNSVSQRSLQKGKKNNPSFFRSFLSIALMAFAPVAKNIRETLARSPVTANAQTAAIRDRRKSPLHSSLPTPVAEGGFSLTKPRRNYAGTETNWQERPADS